jgi:hypothetical protein
LADNLLRLKQHLPAEIAFENKRLLLIILLCPVNNSIQISLQVNNGFFPTSVRDVFMALL